MPRRYRRRYSRYRPLKTIKYSNETSVFTLQPRQDDTTVTTPTTVIASISAQGIRKVKNFTLTFSQPNLAQKFQWALVYVPEGTQPQALAQSSRDTVASMYEPNQNVIMSGIIYYEQAQQTYRSRLARNLNSGDKIVLVIRPLTFVPQAAANSTNTIYACLNYAISF